MAAAYTGIFDTIENIQKYIGKYAILTLKHEETKLSGVISAIDVVSKT